MNIYITFDMEGIAGTHTWTQEENNRPHIRQCMMQQAEWILEGIKSSKVNNSIEEIVIADSHSRGDSILYDITGLDDRLHLISGYPRPNYMMPAFDGSYSIVFFAGYHGGIGTLHSNMDHSYSSRFHRIWFNNKIMNESLINAAYAGYFNVPVGLVIGDDTLAMQLKPSPLSSDSEILSDHSYDTLPWIEYVVTKYSLSRFAVKSRPMNVVKNETIEAVKKVLASDFTKISLYKLDSPVTLKIEFQTASMADCVSMLPDVKRLDGITIELTNDDYAKLFNAIDAISTLAGSVKW